MSAERKIPWLHFLANVSTDQDENCYDVEANGLNSLILLLSEI